MYIIFILTRQFFSFVKIDLHKISPRNALFLFIPIFVFSFLLSCIASNSVKRPVKKRERWTNSDSTKCSNRYIDIPVNRSTLCNAELWFQCPNLESVISIIRSANLVNCSTEVSIITYNRNFNGRLSFIVKLYHIYIRFIKCKKRREF